MNNLPISADSLPDAISPEGATVANAYLELGCSIEKTSELLDMPGTEVHNILNSNLVKSYITQVITDAGLRSMDKITESMQELIDDKMIEMKDLEMTSSKDVADLLQILHKMQVEKSKIVQTNKPKDSLFAQKNQQVNIFNANDNSQYSKLMKAIIGE